MKWKTSLAIAAAATFPLSVLSVAVGAPAHAGPPGPDLLTTITAPNVRVYDVGRYQVNVANRGRNTSGGVVVTIGLPRTTTSPTVHVMGELGTIVPSAGSCNRTATTITCNLGNIGRNRSAQVAFDIRLPYSINPILFTASAAVANEERPQDNSTSHAASLAAYAPSVSAPQTVHNSHCTGRNLSSYFECALYPSSIATHEVVFDVNGVITHPEVTGTWAVTGSRLQFSYYDGPTLVASFDGQGTSDNCWEGAMSFNPDNTYMAMYRTCLA